MRAENDKLVRLSDVIETIKNQCSCREKKWGDDNFPRPPYFYIFIEASSTIDELSNIPAIDAVPVVHAKLLDPNPYGLCSHCNYLIDIRDEFNYCPKCGAMLKTDKVTE